MDGTPLDRNVAITLILLGILLLLRRRIDWSTFNARNRWLLTFCLFALISVFWSDYSFVAFKRWIRDVGNIVMILVILSEEDPANAIRTVFIRCALVLIPLSVLSIKYYPEIGVYFDTWSGKATFRGVTTDKNGLGRLAMLSVFFCLWSLDTQQGGRWLHKLLNGLPEVLILVMCLWLLSKANSSTSIACLALGTTVYMLARVRWIKCNRRLVTQGAIGMLFFVLLSFNASEMRAFVATSLGRKPDLTERTEIWKEVPPDRYQPSGRGRLCQFLAYARWCSNSSGAEYSPRPQRLLGDLSESRSSRRWPFACCSHLGHA